MFRETDLAKHAKLQTFIWMQSGHSEEQAKKAGLQPVSTAEHLILERISVKRYSNA